MSAERFARLKAILAEAYEREGPAREAWVEAACGGDPELLAEVRSLLAADADNAASRGGFALRPTVVAAALEEGSRAAPDDTPVPERLGRYRVLRRVARGGMGTVYEALLESPERRVALKLLRRELVTPELLQRFRREAEILGRLQHAGIAQVLEAGTVADDEGEQPYFAMEFVEGRPLTAWADEHRLGRDQRLRLFARVCEAVDHAHGKGVIHRDLKPDNILVTADGRPKVLDFGVARTTDPGPATPQTETGQVLGTLAYMSPDQVRGDGAAIDARTDVYALGVLLHELLVGERPFDVAHRSVAAAMRLIEEQDATRLGRVDPTCRGDLETIVGKALEKDPARRYAGAGALADDVHAHLRHQPIRARPPSAVYTARKFARRHRGLVTGVSLGLAALLAGLAFAIRFGLDEARQREASEQVTYQTVIESAATRFEMHDPEGAARRMAAAPESLRGWEWRHLQARIDDPCWIAHVDVPGSEEPPFLKPTNRPCWFTAQGLAFSADGTRLVSFVDGHTLGLWDAATGARLAAYDLGADLWTEALALQADTAALATDDGRLLILDLEDGTLLHEERLPGRAQALAWHPDGRRLAVGVQLPPEERALPHEILVGEPGSLRVLHAGTGSLRKLVWLAGGDQLAVERHKASLGYIQTLAYEVLDGTTGEVLRAEPTPAATASLAARPDGRGLFVGSIQRSIQYLPEATQATSVEAHRGHVRRLVLDLALGPDDLAASLDAALLRVWTASTGATREVHRLPTASLHGSCALDPQGRYVATVHPDRLRVWRLGQGGARVLGGPGASWYWLDLTPDGRTLLAYDFSSRLWLWDLASGTRLGVLDPPPGNPPPPYHLIDLEFGVSADGRRVIMRNGPRFAEADLATATAFQPWPRPGGPEGLEAGARPGGADAPDADELPALLRDWVALAGGRVSSPHFVFSPDRSVLLDTHAGSLRDGQSFATLRTLQGPGPPSDDAYALLATAGSFAPDGERLVAAWDGPQAWVYATATGEQLAELGGEHLGKVYAVAWSPDGTRIATGGEDGVIVIWEADHAVPLLHLTGHEAYVYDLRWTPDGRALVSASGDGTIRVWDSVKRAERTRSGRLTASEVPGLPKR